MQKNISKPHLFIFGGLPATGKTTIAKALAERIGACHLRIDTLEQALVRVGLCHMEEIEGRGYGIACELAKDQLNNGVSVIADCVNPLELTRNWWRKVAVTSGCRAIEVEFICSETSLHRYRAENRPADIDGLKLPDWNAIKHREYEAWPQKHLIVDTAHLTISEALEHILNQI